MLTNDDLKGEDGGMSTLAENWAARPLTFLASQPIIFATTVFAVWIVPVFGTSISSSYLGFVASRGTKKTLPVHFLFVGRPNMTYMKGSKVIET